MNKNLGLILAGQSISQIGDKFHMLAVAFRVPKTTGSPAKMGLVLFFFLNRQYSRNIQYAIENIQSLYPLKNPVIRWNP